MMLHRPPLSGAFTDLAEVQKGFELLAPPVESVQGRGAFRYSRPDGSPPLDMVACTHSQSPCGRYRLFKMYQSLPKRNT